MPPPQGRSPEALLLDPGVLPGSPVFTHAEFVGLDWGSTRVRAWLFDDAGAVLDSRSSNSDPSMSWPAQAERLLSGWPVRRGVACGMVGARSGWVEAPYVDCPATLDRICETVTSVPGAHGLQIIGGVAERSESTRLMDVMRGEETLVFGLPDLIDAVVVLPGTHSKWVRLEAAAIAGVRTFLTGELFASLARDTVLRQSIGRATVLDGPGLDPGLEEGLTHGLTASVFRIRVDDLAGIGDIEERWRRLSGLVVGDEVREGLKGIAGAPIVLVAAPPLDRVYQRAFEIAGRPVHDIVDANQAAICGLSRIWKTLRPC